MKGILDFGTAELLSEVGYEDKAACEFYAASEVIVRTECDNYVKITTYYVGDYIKLSEFDKIDNDGAVLIVAPHHSDAIQWLFKEHDLYIETYIGNQDGEIFWKVQSKNGYSNYGYFEILESKDKYFKIQADAWDDAIRNCVEFIKNKK